jgi:ribosomal protein S12 methylthiotransferase accessory factor
MSPNAMPPTDPVHYFAETHRAAKHNGLNPHAHSSAHTLGIMEKHHARIGLTRLVDLTGQDRIGMPVYNAIRPGMVNYSVQHGKGLAREDAKLSAVMESFERYYGSFAPLPAFAASYAEARRQHDIIPFERLAQAKAGIFHRDMAVDWTLGFDIVRRSPVAVPLDLVLLRPQESCRRLPTLQASSNGLASATHFAEAVCQGLLEVIERDAVTCDHFRSRAAGRFLPMDRVDWRSIAHPVIGPLLEKIRAADILPLLFACRSDTGIPTYNCYVANRRNLAEGFFHGMGAGMHEATAMVRAITEAVQARAALRAGTRDVFFHKDALFHGLSDTAGLIADAGGEDGGREFTEYASCATDSFEGDVAVCLERLARVGLDQVIVVRLTPPELDFVVVRVIVPGLEGYLLPLYTPGPRARKMLETKSA